jgi:hypothetical protein
MTAGQSLARRTALAFMAHAGRMLPAEHLPWAEAMRQELHHIENDFEALKWAAGCVLASYAERIRLLDVAKLDLARALLALFIGGEALSMLFATVLTVAYRLHDFDGATFLGRFTPGDDYRRFIPLMDATPWWIHALWVAAAVLFVVSACQLFRKRRTAFHFFTAAWVSGAVGNQISQSMPSYSQVFPSPAPMHMRDYIISAVTALVPGLVAAALWAHGRCFGDLPD